MSAYMLVSNRCYHASENGDPSANIDFILVSGREDFLRPRHYGKNRRLRGALCESVNPHELKQD